MEMMFRESEFNVDISKWKLNNKCNTENMFKDCLLKNQSEKWPQNYKE
jgi:hypothetical protein